MFSFVGALPSAASAEGCPPLFRCFTGNTAQSHFSSRACPPFGLWPLRTGLDLLTRRAGDLPVIVHVVSQRARVLRLRRTEQPLANNVAAVLPSSYSERSRHPDPSAFRSSIAHRYLWSTLQETPRDVSRKTRGQDGFATSFSVGLLNPLQHAGLSRRSPSCRSFGVR